MDTYDRIEAISSGVRSLDLSRKDNDGIGMCRSLGVINEHCQELAPILAKLAHDQGAKKKDIAVALGVPATALRNLERWLV